MAQVFIATSNIAQDPVTVVAQHMEEAFRLHERWRQAHAPHLAGTDAMLVHLTARDLVDQPQLVEFARSGRVGIAWWNSELGDWGLGEPDGEVLGDTAPPPPPARCFAFTTMEPGGTLVVAETPDQAIDLLNAYSHALNGWDARYGDMVEMSPWLLYGPLITVRGEMFAGKTGVAREGTDGFYKVITADEIRRLDALSS